MPKSASCYFAYGLLIDSEFPLSIIPNSPDEFSGLNLGSCRIVKAGKEGPQQSPIRWHHQYTGTDSSDTWLRVGESEESQVLQFTGGPTAFIHDDGQLIEIDTHNIEIEPVELEALILNHILPLVIAYRGHTTLHSSAIHFTHGTGIFLGETGFGKSTLAYHLAGAHHLPLITDDCSVITTDQETQVPSVFPGYPAIRLLNNSPSSSPIIRGKKWVSPSDTPFLFHSGISPIAAIFVLNPDRSPAPSSAISIHKMTQRDAQFALTQHSFRLDPGDKKRLRLEFETLSKLVGQIPVFEITYSHRTEQLDELCEAIRNQLECLDIS